MRTISFLHTHQTFFLALGLMAVLAGCSKDSEPASGKPNATAETPLPIPASSKPFGVEAFDLDNSGDVSRDEFVAYHMQRLHNQFMASDANKDGKLSAAELTRPAPRRIVNAAPARPAPAPVPMPIPDGKANPPAVSTPRGGEGSTTPERKFP